MTDTAIRFSIPDLALHCVGGGEIDPANLRGQKVAIFFCPADPEAATREIDEYCGLAEGFAEEGVWVLGVLEGAPPPGLPSPGSGVRLSLARDEDGRAWRCFAPALEGCGDGDRRSGAAFFFERWGTLRHAWPGSGHALDLLRTARERP